MYMYGGELFGREFIVFFVLLLILLIGLCFAFTVWMLVDCVSRDEKDFKDRTLWIILLTLGFFLGYSFILSIVYYFAVKKKLDIKK